MLFQQSGLKAPVSLSDITTYLGKLQPGLKPLGCWLGSAFLDPDFGSAEQWSSIVHILSESRTKLLRFVWISPYKAWILCNERLGYGLGAVGAPQRGKPAAQCASVSDVSLRRTAIDKQEGYKHGKAHQAVVLPQQNSVAASRFAATFSQRRSGMIEHECRFYITFSSSTSGFRSFHRGMSFHERIAFHRNGDYQASTRRRNRHGPPF